MLFQFQWALAMAQQITAMMRGPEPEPTIAKAEEPNTATSREQREIATLKAMYALPAYTPPHERFLGGMFAAHPGRLFTLLSMIFVVSTLGGL